MDVMHLHVDGTTPIQGSDAVAFLWTRLFRTLSLSDAVSFGRECSSSDASALPRTRVLLFLRTRMLFFGRFCSYSDADASGGVLTTVTRVP